MRAVGYRHNGPIDRPAALEDVELADPTPGPRDLLVAVNAVSVNPVDTLVRAGMAPEGNGPRVLGFDAVGVVAAVGPDVTLFGTGDRVYYAGSIARPGTNSELHLVDERIAALAPTSLDDGHAAALPLTAITAWELLFDRLGVPRGGGEGQTLLVVGAAGGVGSILVQLAAKLTKLAVVATASRPETADWVRSLGAHAVLDHHRNLSEQLRTHNIGQVEYIAGLTHTDAHFDDYAEAVAPQGHIAIIDDPETLDVVPLKTKAAALHWEFMFARPVHETPDMQAQHDLLTEVAALIDDGTLRTTADTELGEITAANLIEAHRLVEAGSVRGKIVLAGWPS